MTQQNGIPRFAHNILQHGVEDTEMEWRNVMIGFIRTSMQRTEWRMN
jgi:hypothetical protein